MKPRQRFWGRVLIILVSLLMIFFGLVYGGRLFVRLEDSALCCPDAGQMVLQIRSIIYSFAVPAALVIAGIGILLLMLGFSLRESSGYFREAEALRLKNEAMEELNRQTQTLAHHQRLQMLGTLTSSIAHEFNNLLTPIMGYSLMALEKLPPDEEELYDNLLEVYNASRTAKTLISRLSDLSRKNTDESFRVVSADDLIQRALDVAQPAKPEAVSIRLDLNCQDQRIRANEIQISQLLLNLILNAFAAMEPSGGVLTIRTSYDETMFFLKVEDTGCGIADEDLPRIFDPFFTTKDRGKGTGLGLAIAAQVVEDHSGTIRVQSRLGEGTSFTVSLPRA